MTSQNVNQTRFSLYIGIESLDLVRISKFVVELYRPVYSPKGALKLAQILLVVVMQEE